MSLTIKSNQSSSIALRAMQTADAAMTRSLAKLASGSRVQSARDDAAALAIGSRLKAELTALKTVSVNATQGIAMLQIAEGAYARANDMVTRMRALASQAGSSNLSATERGMLDTEFQALKTELNRLAGATTFNGQQIVNATRSYTFDGSEDPSVSGGLIDFSFNMATATPAPGTFDWTFSNSSSLYFDAPDGSQYLAVYAIDPGVSPAGITTRRVTLQIIDAQNGAGVGHLTFAAGTDLSNFFSGGMEFTATGFTSSTFKISTGSSNNSVSTSIFGINATNLGLSHADITTQYNADAAAKSAQFAVDQIARARSQIGAAQNRLDAAQANNATVIENLDNARSAYMDLDIASEMSVFTNQQILVQAGISMVSQANRMPQNLLRLFNGGA